MTAAHGRSYTDAMNLPLLRLFIVANTAVLALVGLVIAFSPTAPLLVRYSAGEPLQSLALVHLLAIALAGAAIVLLVQSRLSLIRELRRFALGLSLANGLISLMALIEQIAFGGRPEGWGLILLPFSAAAALAAMALRSPQPTDIAAEIESLKIPDEIRQDLLRQIGEAAAQEERNRLARDLHDSIKQQLFSINVGTAAAQERWERDPEGARKALADVRRSAREAMVEMQAMLRQLRPEALGTAGLIEALREQCEALGYRTDADVTLELGEPVPDDRMPPGAPEALFRMGQEMLANVARHARARKVRLWLGWQDQDVMLRVVDDGQGFDPAAEASGMGLRNLKERAASLRGKLEIASAPGSGAGLTVRISLVSPPVSVPMDSRRMVLSESFS
jgi:signal transduction histidine kinase